MPKSILEQTLLSLAQDVKDLRGKMDDVLERIGQHDTELKRTTPKKDFRELAEVVEDVRKDADQLIQDVAERATEVAFEKMGARVKLIERDLLMKAEENTVSAAAVHESVDVRRLGSGTRA